MKVGLIKIYVSFLMFFFVTTTEIQAQCFASPGNPVAGSANIGVLQQRIARMVFFHKFSYSDTYYTGTNIVNYNYPSAIENANFNYSGFSFGYGLRPKLTVELEAGYFFNKTQNYRFIDYKLRGYGLSNAVLSAKYNIFKNVDKKTEITIAGGVKIPLRLNPQVVNGVRLDIDVQPSTGNFGFILQALFVKEFKNISARIIFLSRYDNNFTVNRLGYKFGDAYSNSLFLSKHLANKYTELTKDITVICQIRHEYRKQNFLNDNLVIASGSSIIYIAPQLNFNYHMIWNFSLIYEKPLYHNYKGTQLGNNYALMFSITRDFGYHIKW